jgi:SAM-dependent methyltransferase
MCRDRHDRPPGGRIPPRLASPQVGSSLIRPNRVTIHIGEEEFVPFDVTGAEYANRFEWDSKRLGEVIAIVEQRLAAGRVLDLGAAPYIVTSTLAAHGYEVTANGLPITGLDSRGKLNLQFADSTKSIPLVLFDAEGPYPFEDESFDCVVAGEIVEHLIRQPWSLLSESWRVLQPGGLLLLTTPNGHAMEHLYSWLKRGPTGQGFNPEAPTVRHAREYSIDEVSALVASQGFDIEETFTRNYWLIGEDGFPGFLGPMKRTIYTSVLGAAQRRTGLLSNRAQTVVVIARRSARPPAPPPSFMQYGGSDERSGYNFGARA